METQGDLAAVHAAALLDWTIKHRLSRERWQAAQLSDRVDYMRDAAKRLGFAV
ncbi:hypothetical protein [Sphingobium yanoikuyae]|uniref:hypothetical protein n=1 Tax=Sphingobium yanoikuyae TaxID=13690 RepID=UPI0035C75CC1